MSKLSNRERVLLAFNHKEADRVPIDFLGNASLLVDEAYFHLLDHLGWSRGEIGKYRFRRGSTANYYDTRLLELFDIDFRRIFLPVRESAKMKRNGDRFVDYWGIVWKKSDIYINYERGPLEGLDIDGVAGYEWPDPTKIWQTEGLGKQARDLSLSSGCALVARNPVTYGFLDRACNLRGMEQFMMDLLLNPEIARLIIEGVLKVNCKVYELFLTAVGPYVQMVETGDDLGGQNNLLISPKLYREFIKPAEIALNRRIKELAPEARIFMHSDGAIRPIIPDLIEAGVDILNPIQPSAAGMESADLKRDFGEQLIFHGGVDQPAQEGSEAETRAEVRRRIDALAPGGGYVLSTSNHILGAPPENVVAMFDEARTYGAY